MAQHHAVWRRLVLCPALHLFASTQLRVEQIPEPLLTPTQAAAQLCAFSLPLLLAALPKMPSPPHLGLGSKGEEPLIWRTGERTAVEEPQSLVLLAMALFSLPGLACAAGGPAMQKGPEAVWT